MMHRAALVLVAICCVFVSGQEPAKEKSRAKVDKGAVKETGDKKAALESFQALLPANTGLVVTISSRKRLAGLLEEVLKNLPQALTKDAPPPAQVLEELLSNVLGTDGPVEGIDPDRPLGAALTLGGGWSFFVPVKDADAFAKRFDASRLASKGGYSIVTQGGNPVTPEGSGEALHPVAKGDIVLSVRVDRWLRQYKPLVDQFVQMAQSQGASNPELQGLMGILKLEIEVITRILAATAQVDIGLQLDRESLRARMHWVPAEKGIVREVFATCEKAEVKDAASLLELLPARGHVRFDGFFPPEALVKLLDAVPWDQWAGELGGEDGAAIAAWARKVFAALPDAMDGRIAGSLSFAASAGQFPMQGLEVFGVKDGNAYMKLMRAAYDSEEGKKAIKSFAALLPGFELKYERDALKLGEASVDVIRETFAMPGQGPMEISMHVTTLNGVGILDIGLANTKLLEETLRTVKKGVVAGGRAVAAKDGSRRFGGGFLDLAGVLQMVLQSLPPGLPSPFEGVDLAKEELRLALDLSMDARSFVMGMDAPIYKFIAFFAKMRDANRSQPDSPAEAEKKEDGGDGGR